MEVNWMSLAILIGVLLAIEGTKLLIRKLLDLED